jgi:diguanylate cyclase (GGDEF)-like protein/PAS domain S-box-containing protein
LIQSITADGRFLYVNPAWKATLGYQDEDVGNLSVFDIIHPDDRKTCQQKFRRILSGEVVDPMRVRFISKSGETIILKGSLRCHYVDGEPFFAHGIFHNITEQVDAEQRLHHAATHDKLTDLPNRALFFDRLTQAIVKTKRHGEHLAVLFVDLDGFKDVNDTYGHHIGDQLLVAFTMRLRDTLRQSDTAARLSGDEFALIFEDLANPKYAAKIARKIIAACACPYVVEEHKIQITLSIGISIYPEDADNADILLQRADAAMYKVKQDGKNNYAFFSDRYQKYAEADI